MSEKPDLEKYPTIGIPSTFSSYKLSDNSILKVCLVDTCGQEKFRRMNENNYSSTDSIILVYDITDRNSYEDCKGYFTNTINKLCKKDIPVILIGNKKDLKKERKISFEEGQKFASKNNYFFMETSCLKNENVFEAFSTIIGLTKRNMEGDNEIKEKTEKTNLKDKENKECNII